MNQFNPIVRRIGAAVIAILVLIYVIYQIVLLNSNPNTFELAVYSESYDSIDVNMWAVREDVIVSYDKMGELSFNVSEGERIAKNASVADVYENSQDVDIRLQIEKLEQEIVSLRELIDSQKLYAQGELQIGTQINQLLSSALAHNQNQDYIEMDNNKQDLQYYISQKDIVTGEQSINVYEQRLQELLAEQSLLESNTAGRADYIAAPISGYFSSNLDGYENSFDIENIENITVAEIEDIQTTQPPENAVGKITGDFNWYLVGIIDEQQRIKLENITEVDLAISSSGISNILADIISINKDEVSGNYSLVLKCNYLTPSLVSMRTQAISVIVQAYEGVLVPEEAIYFVDITKEEKDENGEPINVVYENVKGVYTLFGDTLMFVQIFSDITIDGYAICKTSLSEEEREMLVTYYTISMYDQVLVESVGVPYDGQAI